MCVETQFWMEKREKGKENSIIFSSPSWVDIFWCIIAFIQMVWNVINLHPEKTHKKRRRQEIYAKHQQTLRYISGDGGWQQRKMKCEKFSYTNIKFSSLSFRFRFSVVSPAGKLMINSVAFALAPHTHFLTPPRRRVFSWDDGGKKSWEEKYFSENSFPFLLLSFRLGFRLMP